MIKQFGDNPKYTITTWYDFTSWKLPFGVNWRCFTGGITGKCFTFEFMFLCFGVQFEIWRYKK